MVPLLVSAARVAAPLLVRGLAKRATSSPAASSPPASSPTARPKLDAEQLRNLATIASVVGRARLPGAISADALTLAAVVNAWYESRLRARAHNPKGEDSIGLFQVNRNGTLGAPYSREQLRRPDFNTAVILTEVQRRSGELLQARTIQELTTAFAVHVERPTDRFRVGEMRGRSVRIWWGSLADAPVTWTAPA